MHLVKEWHRDDSLAAHTDLRCLLREESKTQNYNPICINFLIDVGYTHTYTYIYTYTNKIFSGKTKETFQKPYVQRGMRVKALTHLSIIHAVYFTY